MAGAKRTVTPAFFYQDVQKNPEKVGGRDFKVSNFGAQIPWTISVLMSFWTYPWGRKPSTRDHDLGV